MKIYTRTGIRIVTANDADFADVFTSEGRRWDSAPKGARLLRFRIKGEEEFTCLDYLPADCEHSDLQVCEALLRLTWRGEDISVKTVLAEAGARPKRVKIFLAEGWKNASDIGYIERELALASIRYGVYANIQNPIDVAKDSDLWRDEYADTWLEVTGYEDKATLEEIAEKIRREYCG